MNKPAEAESGIGDGRHLVNGGIGPEGLQKAVFLVFQGFLLQKLQQLFPDSSKANRFALEDSLTGRNA